jgi:hypothetical protein
LDDPASARALGDERLHPERVTRRRALRTGGYAAAAGVVWTSPVVRSQRISAATGTPPPTTSTTTPPATTRLEIEGTGTGTVSVFGSPNTPLTVTITLQGDWTGLGPSSLLIEGTVTSQQPNFASFVGTFTIQSGAGELAGGTFGSVVNLGGAFAGGGVLQVSNGTGDFAGATGELSAGVGPDDVGSISGAIEIPA